MNYKSTLRIRIDRKIAQQKVKDFEEDNILSLFKQYLFTNQEDKVKKMADIITYTSKIQANSSISTGWLFCLFKRLHMSFPLKLNYKQFQLMC